MIAQFLYDGSWFGLCTCLFACYEYKLPDVNVGEAESAGHLLFGESKFIETDEVKARRVIAGIQRKAGKTGVEAAYSVYLSEIAGRENLLLRYLRYLMSGENAHNNFGDPDVLAVQQIAKKVSRERHRMKAFIRFSVGSDGLFYAGVEPYYNVLPLVVTHFKDRYADQRWLIYDLKRKYGFYYDLQDVAEVQLRHQPAHVNTNSSLLDVQEEHYQILWQQYFKSVNIPARKNTRLHVQHVPKRYWKHLTEKWRYGDDPALAQNKTR